MEDGQCCVGVAALLALDLSCRLVIGTPHPHVVLFLALSSAPYRKYHYVQNTLLLIKQKLLLKILRIPIRLCSVHVFTQSVSFKGT